MSGTVLQMVWATDLVRLGVPLRLAGAVCERVQQWGVSALPLQQRSERRSAASGIASGVAAKCRMTMSSGAF